MKPTKIILTTLFFLTFILFAHGGRVNKAGCHKDKSLADKKSYHCHGKSLKQGKKNKRSKSDRKNEAYYNDLYAKKIGGIREVSYEYKYDGGGGGKVMVDIETETEVIEGGKDKRSSLDSLQQALFFSVLTDKKPVVVIYDTDGKVGKYEYRIQQACKAVGVEYRRVKL